jgi:hypothetical protein
VSRIIAVVGELGVSLATEEKTHGREEIFAGSVRCMVGDWDDLANILAGLIGVQEVVAGEMAPKSLTRDKVVGFGQLAAGDVARSLFRPVIVMVKSKVIAEQMISCKLLENLADIAVRAGLWEALASLADILCLTLTLWSKRGHRVVWIDAVQMKRRWLGATVDIVLVTAERTVECLCAVLPVAAKEKSRGRVPAVTIWKAFWQGICCDTD